MAHGPTSRGIAARVAACGLSAATVLSPAVHAVDFRSTADSATVLYDAPSTKAKPLFILGRDTPLEVIVVVEGWVKVRDAGGTIGWAEKRTLADKRSLVVRAPVAEVRAAPDDNAPLVFRAEQNVLLEPAEPLTGAAATEAPGWVKVKHRDGQVGYVRIARIFGL